jgi:NADPH2:quinone reductase
MIFGEGVTHLSVGDRVAALTVIGGNSEVVCLKADQVVQFPNDIDPSEALCMVLSYTTAVQMLHRIADVKQGDVILIHGASGVVGNALGQLGALAGLKMFGTASKSKHELLQKANVIPIDYHIEDFKEVIKSQYPEGIEAVFDPFGGGIARNSFELLKRNGILIGYGFRNQAEGKMALVGLEILRLKLWNWLPNGKRAAFYSIDGLRKQRLDWFKEDLKHLFNLLKDGKVKPIIAAKMPLTQAAEAHKLVENDRPSGKVILLPITGKHEC